MPRRRTKGKKSHRKREKVTSSFSNAVRRLKRLKASDQHQAMSMANKTFIRQFCMMIKKLKHAKLSPKHQTALKKHRKKIHKLLSSRTGMSKRRQMLTQGGGGFLKSLLSAIPVVGTVVDLIDNV